jgi:hypothetical protein
MTTAELQMSEEKWRASASNAWLLYFLAIREREVDLEISTMIEIAITAKEKTLTSTEDVFPMILPRASAII